MVLGARPPLQWKELETTVVDQKATVLCRLYSWPGGEWDEPEPKYRSLRVDPPGDVAQDLGLALATARGP